MRCWLLVVVLHATCWAVMHWQSCASPPPPPHLYTTIPATPPKELPQACRNFRPHRGVMPMDRGSPITWKGHLPHVTMSLQCQA